MHERLYEIYRRSGAQRVRVGIRNARLLLTGIRLASTGSKVVNSAGRVLYVDPWDRRAQRLALSGGHLSGRQARLWPRLVQELAPSVVIDVGANYGESVLSATYPSAIDLHVVEPNPRVLPYLRRTLDEAALSAYLHQVAATDVDGEVTLTVPRSSSGLGTLEATNGVEHRVKGVRLDSLIDVQPADRLLFKIDVEGHEPAVLRGMRSMIDTADVAWGLCEMWSASEAFLVELFARFRVYLVGADEPVLVDLASIRSHLTQIQAGTSTFSQDVLLQAR